jgi:hypothetical protein
VRNAGERTLDGGGIENDGGFRHLTKSSSSSCPPS